jgi:hypothetical protein
MGFSGKIKLDVVAALTGPLDLSAPVDSLAYSHLVEFATGAGVNQANMLWHDQRTLAPSATEDLDLAGVLVNGLGALQTFVRIKALIVAAALGNTNAVNVARSAANGVPIFLAAGDGIALAPGASFHWDCPNAAGVVVTPATADLITITNAGAGTSVTYDVIVIGASS